MEETIFKTPQNIENKTFDDDWDKIVNYDQISYNEGYAAAVLDVREETDNNIINYGLKTGFLRGFAIALELGYYESVLNSKSIQSNISSSNPRVLKRSELISKRASELPNKNVDNIDFDKEVSEIRALFKSCKANAGSFRPSLNSGKDSLKEISNEELSQEW